MIFDGNLDFGNNLIFFFWGMDVDLEFDVDLGFLELGKKSEGD